MEVNNVFPLQDLTKFLHEHWGYTSFRGKQQDIIEAILSKRDTLALLPTGGGKSICYQLPGIIQHGTCLVISPLIALMIDQVQGLKKKGIQAEALHSGLSVKQIDNLLDPRRLSTNKTAFEAPPVPSTIANFL